MVAKLKEAQRSVVISYEQRQNVLLFIQALGFGAWGWLLDNRGVDDAIALRVAVVTASFFCFLYFVFFKPQEKVRNVLLYSVLYLANIQSAAALYYSEFHVFLILGGMIVISASLTFFRDFMSAGILAAIWIVAITWLVQNAQLSIDPVIFIISYGISLLVGLLTFVGITEAIREVKVNKELANTVLENMMEGVVLHDRDASILVVNPSACRILGLSEDQIRGKTNFDPQWQTFRLDGSVCPPEEHPSYLAMQTRKPVMNFSLILRKGDGSRAYLSISALPLECLPHEKPQVLVTIQDMTEVELKQQKIAEQQAILAHSAKLSALGEMAAGIAHEINNPLAIVQGRIIQLEDSVPQTTQTKELLKSIEDGITRVAEIVRSMRALVKDNSQLPKSKVSIANVVNDVLNISRLKFKESNIDLKFESDQAATVLGHSGQLSQVVLNLVNNALDAVHGQQNPWIKITSKMIDENVVLEVRNSGNIPADILSKLGQPFFSTKLMDKGTGLGLSISMNIVKNHQGTFEFGNEVDTTYFRFKLPKAN